MSKKDEYAGKYLGYTVANPKPLRQIAERTEKENPSLTLGRHTTGAAPASAESAKERQAGLPGSVVHIRTLPSADSWEDVQFNVKGDTPPNDCQMEGSTGKRIYIEGNKSGKTEGYSVMQPGSHQGETNLDGTNPMSPNRKK